MKAPQILIVDDDAELQALLARVFDRAGWRTESARSIAQAEHLLASHLPEVVVLEMIQPDGNGLDLCRRWRQQHPALCILILSTRDDPLDKVLELEVGADDYLGKPFEQRELIARVRALLRRHGRPPMTPPEPSARLEFDGLAIDMLQREARAGGGVMPLTGVEFKVLLALVQVPGRLLSGPGAGEAAGLCPRRSQLGGARTRARAVGGDADHRSPARPAALHPRRSRPTCLSQPADRLTRRATLARIHCGSVLPKVAKPQNRGLLPSIASNSPSFS